MAKKRNNRQNYNNKSNKNNDVNKKYNNKSNISNKKNININNHKKNNVKREEELEILDFTNGAELTFDDIRLMDVESLDTSFLEGRNKKKKVKNIIRDTSFEMNKVDSRRTDKNYDEVEFTSKKGSLFKMILVIILSLLIGFGSCFALNSYFVEPEIKTVEKEVVKTVIDDNYLFLGDSITELYELEEYFEDMPVVNSGISGNTTKSILDNMEERVYRYNPSKVFLLIGINDFANGVNNERIIENIHKIINLIQKNRSYAKIYVQSIYPINDTEDDKIDHNMVNIRANEKIIELNNKLQEIVKEEKLTYIDMFSLLTDDEGNLDLDYTTDGLHISEEGYEIITDELMKYINE